MHINETFPVFLTFPNDSFWIVRAQCSAEFLVIHCFNTFVGAHSFATCSGFFNWNSPFSSVIQAIIEQHLSSARSSNKNSHKWTMSLYRQSDFLWAVFTEERSKAESKWMDRLDWIWIDLGGSISIFSQTWETIHQEVKSSKRWRKQKGRRIKLERKSYQWTRQGKSFCKAYWLQPSYSLASVRLRLGKYTSVMQLNKTVLNLRWLKTVSST